MSHTATKKSGHKAVIQQTGNFKLAFDSPFVVKWPSLQPDDVSFLLSRLKSDLACCARKRGQEASGRPAKQAKVGDGQAIAVAKAPQQPFPGQGAPGQAGKRPLEAEASAAARRELVVGLNGVTAALEAGRALRLVLVCKDVSPLTMVQHVPLLCRRRGVPVCAVPGLGAALAPTLGVKSVAAIAFAEAGGPGWFNDAVQIVLDRIAPVSVPWLRGPGDSAEHPPSIAYLAKQH